MRKPGEISVLIISVFILAGCAKKGEEMPALPDSTMVRVLTDFHLLAARAELLHDIPPAYRDSVYKVHKVDSVAFRKSMSFYAKHPDAYLKLYRKVLDHLNAEMVRQK